jgi:hypothetical protein
MPRPDEFLDYMSDRVDNFDALKTTVGLAMFHCSQIPSLGRRVLDRKQLSTEKNALPDQYCVV